VSSLQKTPAGYRVQFRVSGKAQQISLPDTKKRLAESVQRHIDELIACKRIGDRPQELTRKWVDGLSDRMRERLEAFGLVEARTRSERSLVDLFDDFVLRRDINAATAKQYQQTRKKIQLFFGQATAESIRVADADDFRVFLSRTCGLAENTVRKITSRCSTFFKWLLLREIVARNPFENLPKTVGSAIDEKRFIDACDIEAVIAQTTDPQVRLLIALARWGGLRVPSEPKALRWKDVNWGEKKITVTASKTGSVRTVPIFPELREHFDAAWKAAEPGEEWVLPRVRNITDPFWKEFRRLIEAAGLTPWPRLWSSLRSTRETELAASYPIHVVCAWIGNSPSVALRHYLRPTDSDFERASADIAPAQVARQ